MIIKHINKLMVKMSEAGDWWAKRRCYVHKTRTKEEAYIVGYLDCCEHLREYILHNHLDKPTGKCYTSAKARKK